MNRRLILWVVTILLLLVSLPGLLSRWEVERSNNTYELVLPFNEIYNLTVDDTVSIDEALGSLKEAGLDTVSISPFSLTDLERHDVLTIYSKRELKKILQLTSQADMIEEGQGFYVTVPVDPYYDDVIQDQFDVTEVMVNEQQLYFIPTGRDHKDKHSNLGYDHEIIQKVKEHDLHYILRIENDESDDINEQTVEQLLQLADDSQLSNLLFSGVDVLGYPGPQSIIDDARQLNDAGFDFYSIEFTNQRGLRTLARSLSYDTIRLHSIHLSAKPHEETVNQVIRAVKERNIRSVFFHIQSSDPEENLDQAIEFITSVQTDMPKQFTPGIPTPFDQIEVPLWSLLAALFAGVLFVFIATEVMTYMWIRMTAVAGMLLLMGGYFVLEKLFFLQVFALGIAIVAPVYAVLLTSKEGSLRMGTITHRYLQAIGVSLTGIVIILGAMNGNGYISGFELFRGVKLVYLVPPILVMFLLIWNKKIKLSKATEMIKLTKQPVQYWHIIVMGIVAGFGFYYMTRTGNAGTASELEMVIRQKLESILYVRPRTKEFLIGFPLYMLALYVTGINKKWGKFLFIPGIIGFLSMINTFTHLHIPLHVSLLRTGYSIVLGYVFGLLFIYLFVVCYRYVTKTMKKRWT